MKDIKFEFTGDIDTIIDERGNKILKLATVSWNDRPAKLELRNWVVNTSTGDLLAQKGVTFSSKEVIDELTHTLLKLGYGNNTEIKQIMEEERSTKLALIFEEKQEEEQIEDAEYYDPKELLN